MLFLCFSKYSINNFRDIFLNKFFWWSLQYLISMQGWHLMHWYVVPFVAVYFQLSTPNLREMWLADNSHTFTLMGRDAVWIEMSHTHTGCLLFWASIGTRLLSSAECVYIKTIIVGSLHSRTRLPLAQRESWYRVRKSHASEINREAIVRAILLSLVLVSLSWFGLGPHSLTRFIPQSAANPLREGTALERWHHASAVIVAKLFVTRSWTRNWHAKAWI